MGQARIRGLADETIAALKQRAAARGQSLDAKLREIITRAARLPRTDLIVEFARSRAQTPDTPRDLAEDVILQSRESHEQR